MTKPCVSCGVGDRLPHSTECSACRDWRNRRNTALGMTSENKGVARRCSEAMLVICRQDRQRLSGMGEPYEAACRLTVGALRSVARFRSLTGDEASMLEKFSLSYGG